MLNIRLKIIAIPIIVVTLATTVSSFADDYSVDSSQVLSQQYDDIVELIADNQQDKFFQLLETGFDINSVMLGDGTPLIIAIQNNHNQFAGKLIELGADIELAAPQDANPLINAAIYNNIEMVKLLLTKGAFIDAIVKYDETALIAASREGHLEMVKLLVANGANVNQGVNVETVKGIEYRSPLNVAGNIAIANFLRKHGAKQ